MQSFLNMHTHLPTGIRGLIILCKLSFISIFHERLRQGCSFTQLCLRLHAYSLTLKAQSKKEGKDQELIQSSTTPTQDTNGKVTSQLDITNESQEVSPFPTGDLKATYNLQQTTFSNFAAFQEKINKSGYFK